MNFLSKTFGKLNRAFYIREFLFGLIFYIPLLYICYIMYTENEKASFFQIFLIVLFYTLLQFLYPYSRYVYHSIADYIIGNDVYMVNIILLLIIRFFFMVICWSFGFIIAPIGLIYLYFKK